ncbi:MAG: DUF3866 family protein [Actinomycetota bacterium]|nr:DUF3866 family protein [Actinomycetota bacterium]
MAAWAEGRISEVLEISPGLVRARATVSEGEISAIGFPSMLGPVRVGDRVVLNVTGLELGLGTGGDGFILWNLDGDGAPGPGEGHIIKLRYTPWQTEVAAAEAPESPHHAVLSELETLSGMPVVVCGLHSQIAGVVAGVKEAAGHCRIGYLMSDGAALPLAWSRLVASLRSAGLIDVTCTSGHAFGGDLESINAYSGLAALRTAGAADVVVVAMGPGIVGSATRLGFSGMEVGALLDAAGALQGHAVASLRISFSDPRPRHRGVSHHSLTALRLGTARRATIAVPQLPEEHEQLVQTSLVESGLGERHELAFADGQPGVELLRRTEVEVTSMGRTLDETPELWVAAAAAGRVATKWL